MPLSLRSLNAAIVCSVLLISFLSFFVSGNEEIDISSFRIFTVATNETDGFKRFVRSARKYDLEKYIQVLGMGQAWEGGDVRRFTGGGHKVNLMKAAMDQYKGQEDMVVMFVDSYDVIFVQDAKTILKKFSDMNTRLLLSAEKYLWPDKSLESVYPRVQRGLKYVNSGLFMGYAPEIWKALTHKELSNWEDDQLHFTQVYLNPQMREEMKIKLDSTSIIFQNINGVEDETKIRLEESSKATFQNQKYHTEPAVIHGNGAAKNFINYLSNYLADSWSLAGCTACSENTISLDGYLPEDLPRVVVAVFVEQPSPFIAEFFHKLTDLNYPKNKIDLFLHNRETFHQNHIDKFLERWSKEYRSVNHISPKDNINQWSARNAGLEFCKELNCEYYFSVDADVHLENSMTLKLLIEQNRTVLVPMVTRDKKLWSNFWGALSDEGYYARSDDYIDIVRYKRKGVWNVPYMAQVYLVHGSLVRQEAYRLSFIYDRLDADMAFCRHLRDQGIFLYVTNLQHYGTLVNTESFGSYLDKKHPDLFQLMENRKQWEEKYINPDYYRLLENSTEVEQPCPDVYKYPLMSKTHARELIEEMEHFGKWSGGTNKDERLEGGYENVPTRDIHMKQIGMEKQWLYFLKEFVSPVQEKVFPGYYSKTNAIMNFVVRYKPDEQPFLRPHHDSSTFTINVALNQRGIDYEGGGCRFVRYNCSVIGLDVGYTLMHPGRLTHYHEGLYTTKGTRYIMVSFIDP